MTLQKASDIVRGTGHNAVHPGQISVDDAAMVERPYGLVNMIADRMIIYPKQITQ